jgi:elongation factor 1-delta
MDIKALAQESVWIEKYRYNDAERDYYQNLNNTKVCDKKVKETSVNVKSCNNPINDRLYKVEQENQALKKTVNDLQTLISKLELRVSSLEGSGKQTSKAAEPKVDKSKQILETKKDEDNDDDIDLFGSDDDEEADEVRKKRLEDYAAKKSKKPGVIAKSSVVLDVKPWDDETDMQEMEKQVRTIEMDGLLWGACKYAFV